VLVDYKPASIISQTMKGGGWWRVIIGGDMHSSLVVRETEGDCSGQRRRSEDITVDIAPPYIRFLAGVEADSKREMVG
jgi:hypothetical protein